MIRATLQEEMNNSYRGAKKSTNFVEDSSEEPSDVRSSMNSNGPRSQGQTWSSSIQVKSKQVQWKWPANGSLWGFQICHWKIVILPHFSKHHAIVKDGKWYTFFHVKFRNKTLHERFTSIPQYFFHSNDTSNIVLSGHRTWAVCCCTEHSVNEHQSWQ